MEIIVSVKLREKGRNSPEARAIIWRNCLKGAEKTGYTENYLNKEFMNRRPVYFKFEEGRAKEFCNALIPHNNLFDVIYDPLEPPGGFCFPTE